MTDTRAALEEAATKMAANLTAVYIYQVDVLPPTGDLSSDWMEILVACGSIEEAKWMAFAIHPDYKIGTVELFVARKVWTR